MRFVCDSCKTKYSIEDARVKGKVLKIRCKTCSNVITVREEPAGAASSGGSSPSLPISKPASPTGPQPLSKALENSFHNAKQHQDFAENSERTMISSSPSLPAQHEAEWFVSFDGEQEGPHSVERAAERVRDEQAKGKEAHAWRDGFDGWLPAMDVPELLRAVRALAPRPMPMPAVRTAPVPAAAARPTPVSPRTTPTASTMHDMKAPSLAARGNGSASPALATRPSALAKSTPVAVQPAPVAAVPNPVAAVPTPVAVTAPQPTPTPTPMQARQSEPVVAAVPTPTPAATPASTMTPAATPTPDKGTAGAGVDLFISEPSVFGQVPASVLAPPAPVVIVAPGSAPAHSPWIRWFAVGAGLTTLLLLGAVGYLLFIKPKSVVASTNPPTTTTTPEKKNIDDQPLAVNEGPNRVNNTTTPPSTHVDPKHSTATKTAHVAGTKTVATKANPASATLNKDQSALAALYASEDKTSEHSLPKTTTAEKPTTSVNQNEIYDVIRKNKQSLTMCYERVLKHDNSLKKGRVEVEVKVGVSGMVTKVTIPSSEFSGSDIGSCLTQAIRRWHFPSTGAEYEAGFPLILQAAN